MLIQGLILMVTGVLLVMLFLGLLVAILSLSARILPRFNHILPDEQPRVKTRIAKSPKAHAHDEEIAVAIAAVTAHQQAAAKK